MPLRRAIVVTTYDADALSGRNAGASGYSYSFVAHQFRPLLERWGEVIEICRPESELASTVARLRSSHEVVHLGFRAFQDYIPAEGVPNIICPAWEFPEVPTVAFGGDPRNDWRHSARSCDVVMVSGAFTRDALERSSVDASIHIVPVPIHEAYFDVPSRSWNDATIVAAPSFQFGGARSPIDPIASVAAPQQSRRAIKAARRAYHGFVRPLLPDAMHTRLAANLEPLSCSLQHPGWSAPPGDSTTLTGVVYTSIFSPTSGRKNHMDTLTAFLIGLKDCDDATLVLKLITVKRGVVQRFLDEYRSLGIDHRCRLVVFPGHLSQTDLLALTRASTYYFTTTRAEGNCLPLMDHLAAGRPAVSPCHNAIADYLTPDHAFILASHPEPTSWPHDPRRHRTTTWHRAVWPAIVEQLQESYRVAKADPARYAAMATAARRSMADWASPERVWPRLAAALDAAMGCQTAGSLRSAG